MLQFLHAKYVRGEQREQALKGRCARRPTFGQPNVASNDREAGWDHFSLRCFLLRAQSAPVLERSNRAGSIESVTSASALAVYAARPLQPVVRRLQMHLNCRQSLR